MNNLPNPRETSEEFRFVGYAEEFVNTTDAGVLEVTASLLQTAYLDEGCLDEPKLDAFKEFAGKYLANEGKQEFDGVRKGPLSGTKGAAAVYLMKTYKLLRERFDKKFEQRVTSGTPLPETAQIAESVRGEVKKGFPDLHLETKKLGYVQVSDPRQAIGGKGTHAWPVKNQLPKHLRRKGWRTEREQASNRGG